MFNLPCIVWIIFRVVEIINESYFFIFFESFLCKINRPDNDLTQFFGLRYNNF